MEQQFTIDSLHLDDLENKKHLSIFDENEAYDMLILRIPEIKEMHDLQVTVLGFILTEETSYLYNDTTKTLEPQSFQKIDRE